MRPRSGCGVRSSDDAEESRDHIVGEGYIDLYGYHAPSQGWMISGWISNDWIARATAPIEVVAHFEHGSQSAPAVLNYYQREDIRDRGLGIVAHLAPEAVANGRLVALTVRSGDVTVAIKPATAGGELSGADLRNVFHGLVDGSDPGAARRRLLSLVARTRYEGRETLSHLPEPVFAHIDEAISCAPDSVVLAGWLLAKPGTIGAIRLCSSDQSFPIDMNAGIVWFGRGDVIDAVGREHGFDDPNCGFLARVPAVRQLDGTLHLEIETTEGDIGFKDVPSPRLDGIAAMKRILDGIDNNFVDVDSVYDNVLGPSIAALNARRLEIPPSIDALQFGDAPQAPRYSLIVPLFGRIDFVEFQMALFAKRGVAAGVEITYVLDDPPLTPDARFLAASLYERLRIPFRLLCLNRNVGFAPANNIGAAASSGTYICLMNSDVFPTTGDWFERLAAHLEADATLGAVGPLLLFEDDSVQHQGIYFKKLPQFGNWAFPHHTRKGLRPPVTGGLVREPAITGACMVLRRETFLAHGGLDEAFAVGDFEDTDLCLKLMDDGLGAAVDLDVRMYHLERKSQAAPGHAWRMNLTLYNAWVHQRRWGATIDRLSEPV
jgi:O-antigen biosynthesis protein